MYQLQRGCYSNKKLTKKNHQNNEWKCCTLFIWGASYISLSLKSKAVSHCCHSSRWQPSLKTFSTESHFSGRLFSCLSWQCRIITEKEKEPGQTQPWTLAAGCRLRQAVSCWASWAFPLAALRMRGWKETLPQWPLRSRATFLTRSQWLQMKRISLSKLPHLLEGKPGGHAHPWRAEFPLWASPTVCPSWGKGGRTESWKIMTTWEGKGIWLKSDRSLLPSESQNSSMINFP